MGWLLRLARWFGRIRDFVARTLVRIALFSIYILGVGTMAIGLRLRAIGGRRTATTGFEPRSTEDCAPHIVE